MSKKGTLRVSHSQVDWRRKENKRMRGQRRGQKEVEGKTVSLVVTHDKEERFGNKKRPSRSSHLLIFQRPPSMYETNCHGSWLIHDSPPLSPTRGRGSSSPRLLSPLLAGSLYCLKKYILFKPLHPATTLSFPIYNKTSPQGK